MNSFGALVLPDDPDTIGSAAMLPREKDGVVDTGLKVR